MGSGSIVGTTESRLRLIPYHPQTQGKVERDHRTMKNVIKLQHDYFPWEPEAVLRNLVAYYNNKRYHESIDHVTSADVYFESQYEVLTERAKIKRLTTNKRKREYVAARAGSQLAFTPRRGPRSQAPAAGPAVPGTSAARALCRVLSPLGFRVL